MWAQPLWKTSQCLGNRHLFHLCQVLWTTEISDPIAVQASRLVLDYVVKLNEQQHPTSKSTTKVWLVDNIPQGHMIHEKHYGIHEQIVPKLLDTKNHG